MAGEDREPAEGVPAPAAPAPEEPGDSAARHPERQALALFSTSTSAAFDPNQVNVVQEEILPAACVRLDAVRFDFDSSFVVQEARRELRLLAKLRDDVPDMPVSIFAHADPVGDDDYNKKLSGRRAAASYGVLTRRTDIWEEIYANKPGGKFVQPVAGDDWGLRVIQRMLDALGHNPGASDGKMSEATKAAIRRFTESPQGSGLDPTVDPSHPTRGKAYREKLFRAYMDFICVDAKGAPFELKPDADFVGAGADASGKGDYQGCSEFNPLRVFAKKEDAEFKKPANKTKRDEENQKNRRVLIFLFRPGFHMSPKNWPCPRAKDGFAECRKRFHKADPNGDTRRSPQQERREYEDTRNTPKSTVGCRFYDRLALESPCEGGGAPVQSHLLRVHLRLLYRDPDDTNRVIPPGFPVQVTFPAGAPQNETVAADGRVDFTIDRRSLSFTLVFEPPTRNIAVAGAAGGTEGLLSDADLQAAYQSGSRVFLLPAKFSLADSHWNSDGARKTEFTGLDTAGFSIGSQSSPVELVLDPHWQFSKFLYFDRKLKKTLSVLPIVVEGFRVDPKTVVKSAAPPASSKPGDGLIDPSTGADVPSPIKDPFAADAAAASPSEPDTRSNWTTADCQCLPWILQDQPKPDKSVLVQFRTAGRSVNLLNAAGTFIDSSTATRNLLTSAGSPDVSSSDPGLARGASSPINFDEPNAARLAFYDLPPVWKSRDYFARFFTADNAPTNKQGKFQDLAADPTSKARPLLISLDDIVFVDDILANAAWNPRTDRIAVLSNELHKGIDGALHRKDSNTPYLSLVPTAITDRNYLVEHPDFTRVICMGGSIFDVFDHRTPDSTILPVGARAAVRWFDGRSLGGPGTAVTTPKPKPPKATFGTVQGFFEQQHPNRGGIGRVDLALLRCCDAEGDVEVAVNLHYFRYNFDFSPAPIASRNTTANDLSAAKQTAFVIDAMRRLPQRWNGPEAGFHKGGAQLITPATGPKVRFPLVYFFQGFPQPLTATFEQRAAHYTIDIFKKVRAFMSSGTGRGALEQDENVPRASDGRYTLAHESGHADSLEDEYIETSDHASYGENGFEDFIPGSPYDADEKAMMKGNFAVRPRHYWHAAEWVRTLTGTTVLVQHDGFTFKVPPHPQAPVKTFVTTPWREARKTHASGFSDVYLFRLGAEPFGFSVLNNGPFDGYISVVVRMKCQFVKKDGSLLTDHNTLVDRVTKMRQAVQKRLNGIFFVAGSVGGETYRRCRLTFSPRFLVVNDSRDADYHRDVGVNATTTYAQVVAGVESNFGTHHNVNINERGGTVLNVSSSGPGTLDFNRDQLDLEDDFPRFFAGMLGVPPTTPGAVDQPQSYVTLAQQVIPNATVQKLS